MILILYPCEIQRDETQTKPWTISPQTTTTSFLSPSQLPTSAHYWSDWPRGWQKELLCFSTPVTFEPWPLLPCCCPSSYPSLHLICTTTSHCCHGSGHLWPLLGTYICYQLNQWDPFMLWIQHLCLSEEGAHECYQTCCCHFTTGNSGIIFPLPHIIN